MSVKPLRVSKLEALMEHLQPWQQKLGRPLVLEADPEACPQVMVHVFNQVVWMDFRQPHPQMQFWGLGYGPEQVYQQMLAEDEYFFNDGYQACFEHDAGFFEALDQLLLKITAAQKT